MSRTNPLLDDDVVDLILEAVVEPDQLLRLSAYADHDPTTISLFLDTCRRVARESWAETYLPMDREPPQFVDGRVVVHPLMRTLWPQVVELGLLTATRPVDVGGQGLPLSIATLGTAYLMAANLSIASYAGLTTGAAHLIEAFGPDDLRERFMQRMYAGAWTGTMALTEPQAGSGLVDVKTRATPRDDGAYNIKGSKTFISGGDQDFTENIVHLVLARIDGAPLGVKGISLFAVPRLRESGEGLIDNDVAVSGVIHKIGWRGVPSVSLELGAAGDCRGFLVGEPHRGLPQMFQMMNEARIHVGLHAVATASVAYQESVSYALDRRQGRKLTEKDPASEPVPIVEHADVRRQLLTQKAIVDGGLALVATCGRLADEAEHLDDAEAREDARLLLDLLTPIAKSFPAERGFESVALAVQVHGGYGYSSEYPVEAWLRDQKLNSIHEGTTGIQSLDLLGRKAVAQGGKPLTLLRARIDADVAAAEVAGVDVEQSRAVLAAADRLGALTAELGGRALAGDVEGMLSHSGPYLDLASVVVVSWMHLKLTTAALSRPPGSRLRESTLRAARLFWAAELSRVDGLVSWISSAEQSYSSFDPAWL